MSFSFNIPPTLISLCLTLSFLLQPALPQAVPPAAPTVQRDTQALAVVQKAISILSGPLDPTQITSIVVTATVSLPTSDPPAQGTVTIEESFSAAGSEFRDTFVSNTLNQTFVSGHGSPALVSNGNVVPFGPHFIQSRNLLHFPWLALARLVSDPNSNIAYVTQTVVNKQAAVQVHFHNDSDMIQQVLSVQDWYFDPTTGLPLRLECRVPSTPNGIEFVQVTSDFSSFQVVQGIAVPFHIVSSADGRIERDMTITSLNINQPIPSTEFDLPAAVTK